jgi:hypothetical protein
VANAAQVIVSKVCQQDGFLARVGRCAVCVALMGVGFAKAECPPGAMSNPPPARRRPAPEGLLVREAAGAGRFGAWFSGA